MSNEIIIATELMASAYLVGSIISMKADDWVNDLPESQRQAARVKAGIYWPSRLYRWLASQASTRIGAGA